MNANGRRVVFLAITSYFFVFSFHPLLASVVQYADEAVIIKAPVGKILGVKRSAFGDKDVYAFTGIPYAKPPIGALRYRKPQPEPPWGDQIWNATRTPPSCLQHSVFSPRDLIWIPYDVQTSEDCLYLNIWSPSLSAMAKRPVMAWLHGGRFIHGSAATPQVDGGNLAALGDVVVVTVAYRLQSFGYLYDGTENAPGNQGLHDQLLALKWIKDNIAAFGGDPSEVTLFGFSAGGMSIGFFLTAPRTRALFKRAIIHSGPVARNGLAKDKSAALIDSLKFAKIFGCSKESCENHMAGSFASCMRNVNASLISALEQNFMDGGRIFMPMFGDHLLPTDPQVAKFTGDRDVLIGYVAREGSVNLYAKFRDVFSKALPPRNVSKVEMLYYLGALHKGLSISELQTLRELYMRKIAEFDYDKLRQALAQEQSDVLINCASVDMAVKLAKAATSAKAKNTVYFYKMNHVSRCSKVHPWLGMTHGDDTPFVFGRPFDKNGCAGDIPFAKKVIQIWSNFANGRKPEGPAGVKWPKFTTYYQALLEITNAKSFVSKLNYIARCKKLKKLKLY